MRIIQSVSSRVFYLVGALLSGVMVLAFTGGTVAADTGPFYICTSNACWDAPGSSGAQVIMEEGSLSSSAEVTFQPANICSGSNKVTSSCPFTGAIAGLNGQYKGDNIEKVYFKQAGYWMHGLTNGKLEETSSGTLVSDYYVVTVSGNGNRGYINTYVSNQLGNTEEVCRPSLANQPLTLQSKSCIEWTQSQV